MAGPSVAAFLAAGYRVVAFDSRGVGATADADAFTVATMVADTARLIESLDLASVRLVAVSMGSYIAQELMLARSDPVSQAALMATRGRHDHARELFQTAEIGFANAGIRLPPNYDARLRLLKGFSRKTLNDDGAVADWIDIFTMWPTTSSPGIRAPIRHYPGERRTVPLPDGHHTRAADRIRRWPRDPPTSAPRWQTLSRMGSMWRLPTPAIWGFLNDHTR